VWVQRKAVFIRTPVCSITISIIMNDSYKNLSFFIHHKWEFYIHLGWYLFRSEANNSSVSPSVKPEAVSQPNLPTDRQTDTHTHTHTRTHQSINQSINPYQITEKFPCYCRGLGQGGFRESWRKGVFFLFCFVFSGKLMENITWDHTILEKNKPHVLSHM
jgi:hypothetical protein